MYICEECRQIKEDVDYVPDPHDEDIYGEINMKYLCTDCYDNRCQEI